MSNYVAVISINCLINETNLSNEIFISTIILYIRVEIGLVNNVYTVVCTHNIAQTTRRCLDY